MDEPRPTAVLLLSCRDQKGLVAAVSDFLYRHGGNIVHADQHTDFEEGIFLQRVEWELADFKLAPGAIAGAFGPVAGRFKMDWSLHLTGRVPRVALFVSKLPHCLYDLLARWRLGEFRAEIAAVVSNHPDLKPIAAEFGVDFRHFPVTPATRAKEERRIGAELERRKIDLVVLARYMQVVGPELVARYRHRMINIHHSFLPAFAGARPYHQAHVRGVKIIGATAHYVSEELDRGPIIDQDVIRVSHRDSVADLVRKGKDLEKVVLARAVDLHLRRRVLVYGSKTVVFD
jgi:formyltetrahydrofolate deformylase